MPYDTYPNLREFLEEMHVTAVVELETFAAASAAGNQFKPDAVTVAFNAAGRETVSRLLLATIGDGASTKRIIADLHFDGHAVVSQVALAFIRSMGMSR